MSDVPSRCRLRVPLTTTRRSASISVARTPEGTRTGKATRSVEISTEIDPVAVNLTASAEQHIEDPLQCGTIRTDGGGQVLLTRKGN